MGPASWFRSAAVVATLLVAGCSSLTGLTPGGAQGRPFDYLRDDMPSLILAFDVPRSLEPLPEGSVLRFEATTGGGAYRHVEARLVRADAGDLAAALPPPGRGRTYYLYGVSGSDLPGLREAQTWARGLPAGTLDPGAVRITVEPRFCAVEPVDPGSVRFSVLAALPGVSGLRPLVSERSVADALAAFGNAPLPACAGHSG